MVGAAGISAFPMSSRVVQKMALEEDPGNILLMHAAGANVSGQIASVVAGGLVIRLVTGFLGQYSAREKMDLQYRYTSIKDKKERGVFMGNIQIALEMMWKGMAGIFVVALVIMVIVYLLGKFGKQGSFYAA